MRFKQKMDHFAVLHVQIIHVGHKALRTVQRSLQMGTNASHHSRKHLTCRTTLDWIFFLGSGFSFFLPLTEDQ